MNLSKQNIRKVSSQQNEIENIKKEIEPRENRFIEEMSKLYEIISIINIETVQRLNYLSNIDLNNETKKINYALRL